MVRRTCAFPLLVALCAVSAAAHLKTGFIDRAVKVSGDSDRYQVYVSRNVAVPGPETSNGETGN